MLGELEHHGLCLGIAGCLRGQDRSLIVGHHTTLLLPEASSRRLQPHRKVSCSHHTREVEGKPGIGARDQELVVVANVSNLNALRGRGRRIAESMRPI